LSWELDPDAADKLALAGPLELVQAMVCFRAYKESDAASDRHGTVARRSRYEGSAEFLPFFLLWIKVSRRKGFRYKNVRILADVLGNCKRRKSIEPSMALIHRGSPLGPKDWH
jgi:hypothetical protein